MHLIQLRPGKPIAENLPQPDVYTVGGHTLERSPQVKQLKMMTWNTGGLSSTLYGEVLTRLQAEAEAHRSIDICILQETSCPVVIALLPCPRIPKQHNGPPRLRPHQVKQRLQAPEFVRQLQANIIPGLQDFPVNNSLDEHLLAGWHPTTGMVPAQAGNPGTGRAENYEGPLTPQVCGMWLLRGHLQRLGQGLLHWRRDGVDRQQVFQA